MAFEKRVCVLKQIKKGFSADGGALSGAVYCERLGDTLTVTPKLLGLAPLKEGRYALVLSIGEKYFCVDCGASVVLEHAPSIKEGFTVLLCFLKTGGESEAIALGSCGADRTPLSKLIAFVSEEKKTRRLKNPLPPNELPVQLPNVPSAPTPTHILPDKEDEEPFRDRLAAAYDDEAIAETDYFESDKNADAAAVVQPQEKEGAGENGASHHATILDTSGSLTYYNEVREKLEKAWTRYPKDERLLTAFPYSEWVQTERGVLLGIIYRNGIPKYLCVASETPMSELIDAKAVFVPFSPCSDEAGMYVCFQSADTGEYITVYES